MASSSFLALLLVAVLARATASLEILVIATVSSPSHHIWTSRLTEGLLAHGHRVTEFVIQAPAAKHPNRTSFVLDEAIWAEENLDLEGMTDLGIWETNQLFFEFAQETSNFTIKSAAFQKLARHLRELRPGHFDVMVIDYVFQEILLGVSSLVGRPPIVAMTAFNLPEDILALMGSPYFASLLPFSDAGAHGNAPLSFAERAANMLRFALYKAQYFWSYLPFVERLYAETFPGAPPLSELKRDVAVALVNTNPALHGAVPLTPSIVEVGGLQARPSRPLPDDLERWVGKEAAPHGFIFMSFGTNIKSSAMPRHRVDAILAAFARVKQRVLWKYEDDEIVARLPANVRVVKWLPQNDLLGHPNIRCFVSHNGGLSTQEASYHGVPILGVPFFADQIAYAKKTEMLGLGRTLRYKAIAEEPFHEALVDVLENPKYRENMARLRRAIRDQKETPLERAVWWVEYVARHGGAPHLRSAALSLRCYQTWMLDVLALWLVLALAAVGVLLLAVRRLAACLCGPAGPAPQRRPKQKAH